MILSSILLLILVPVIHGHELRTNEQMRTGMTAMIDEPHACDNKTAIVILVKSAITHSGNRLVIRQTWAEMAKEKDIPVMFVVGRSAGHVTMEKRAGSYILTGDFTDNSPYNGLCIKLVPSEIPDFTTGSRGRRCDRESGEPDQIPILQKRTAAAGTCLLHLHGRYSGVFTPRNVTVPLTEFRAQQLHLLHVSRHRWTQLVVVDEGDSWNEWREWGEGENENAE